MKDVSISGLKNELEKFRLSTVKISERVNSVGNIWNDDNYASLRSQIGELAKVSRTVIESGERAYQSMDKFFNIAEEPV